MLSMIIIFLLSVSILVNFSIIFADSSKQQYNDKPNHPDIINSKLMAEVVFRGTNFLTIMTFLGPDEMVVLEKNTGKVQRIVNAKM
jgi:hypothetical protein